MVCLSDQFLREDEALASMREQLRRSMDGTAASSTSFYADTTAASGLGVCGRWGGMGSVCGLRGSGGREECGEWKIARGGRTLSPPPRDGELGSWVAPDFSGLEVCDQWG